MKKYKYEPLNRYLLKNGQKIINLNLDEIASILGKELPSCLGDKNNDKLMWNNNPVLYATRSWLEAGYKCNGYDRERDVVCFQKI